MPVITFFAAFLLGALCGAMATVTLVESVYGQPPGSPQPITLLRAA